MKNNKQDDSIDKQNVPDIILGLDVSTACIGCCVFFDDESENGQIIYLNHITPKVSNKIKGIEQLFRKKDIFESEFLMNWRDKGITKVVIEEPLLSSNNINTVATLLRFNGMISDSVYHVLGIVPEYISSYDARKYAFPELMSIRKFNKLGERYNKNHIMSAIKKNNLVLFGDYPWDIDKKTVIWNKVSNIYPNIEWVLKNNGELKKENYDASDALITCKATSNIRKFGTAQFVITDMACIGDNIQYSFKIWDKVINRNINLV